MTAPGTPLVLIVTGPPCTGKTTLARRLARALGLPLVTKDTIKETLFGTLGWSDATWSRRLSGASMALLYDFVEAHVAAGLPCVVEANFYPQMASRAFRRLAEGHAFTPVVVDLYADAAVLAERWTRRSAEGARHPGHHDIAADGSPAVALPGRLAPLEIDAVTIGIDTTAFGSIEGAAFDDLVARIRATRDGARSAPGRRTGPYREHTPAPG